MDSITVLKAIQAIPKSIFSIKDLQKILPLAESSLPTVVMRLKKKGVLRSVTRGWYCLYDRPVMPEEVADKIYYPSYLSFKTVLSKKGIINQIPRIIYLATVKKTYQLKINGVTVIYRQIKPELFFGYHLENQIQTAFPEKALLDLLYFVSWGRETVSFSELDLKLFDKNRWDLFKKRFPERMDQLINQVEKLIPTTRW